MFIYLACFILTLILAAIDEILLKKSNKSRIMIISISLLIILIPSVLAGVRDDTIGTDVLVYCKPFFQKALESNSLISYIQSLPDVEWGYLILNYLLSRFTTNCHWIYFCNSCLVSLFVFLSLYEVRDDGSLFLGEFVYLFFFYNASYNLIRQSIAMALILYAVVKFIKKEYIKTIIFFIIAFAFHRTSLIAIPAFIFLKVFDDNKEGKRKKNIEYSKVIFGLSIIFGAVIIELYLSNIVHFIISIGILPEKFGFYVSGSGTEFILEYLIVYVLSYLITIMNRNRIKWGYAYFCISLLDISLFFLQFQVIWLYRISLYFMFFRIISLSRLSFNFDNLLHKREKNIDELLYVYCILVGVSYWMTIIILWNNHETVPYTSSILGI